MLTPAFSLIVPDLLHPVAFGKYIVAYFDDVSAEEDVPPPFNITIKYKLMKHFEELYFRILDMEKREPGKVNRVEGIAEDEYFNCASGRALRDAIEAFQAHQLEYPDWFERECVDSEEEALESDLQCPLLADVNSSSILQCLDEGRVYSEHPAVVDIPEVCEADIFYSNSASQGANVAVQDVSAEKGIEPRGGPDGRGVLEADLEEEADSSSHLSEVALKKLFALQQALGPFALSSVEDNHLCYPDVASDVIQEGCQRPLSESDQGYISRASPQQDSSLKDDFQDQLNSLSRLQEACLHHSLRC
ncbi:hypothetical protein GN956_G11135 [Arapaima gigas]